MESKLSWHAERTGDGYNHKDDDAYFESPFKSLIKESAQNSIDALDTKKKEDSSLMNFRKEAVNLEYQIIELSGEAKSKWKESIDYDGSYKKFVDQLIKTLKPDGNAGTDTISKKEYYQELRNARQLMSSNKPIYLLNVIDTNTVGLDGLDKKTKDGEHRRFASLFRSTKDSIKGKGAGSWGLGKNSFTSISNLGMFISCSNPKDLKSAGKKPGDKLRIYGMSINHQALLDEDENNYISSYWNFGETKTRDETNSKIYDEDVKSKFPSTNWSKSSWNNKKIAEALLIDQLGEKSGTVIQIPALKVDEFGDNKLEEISNELIKQCALWLWPAILSGKLNVRVSTAKLSSPTNSLKAEVKEVSPETLSTFKLIEPYFNIFKNIKDGVAFSKEFSNESDYFLIDDIEMQIPSPKNERVTNPHFPKLFLKRVAVNEIDDLEKREYRNTVAYLRNPGIVVEYDPIYPKNDKVAYAGVLFAGTSYETNDINTLSEEFLRLAENPSHNRWWPNKQLNKLSVYFSNKEHKWGRVKLTNNLRKPIVNKIISLFSISNNSSGNRNKWMENMYVIKKPPVPKKPHDIIGKRVDQNVIRVTTKLEKEEILILNIKPAQVLSYLDNEKAGIVEVSKINEVGKTSFREIINFKNLYVEKYQNKLLIKTMDTAKSFSFDIVLKNKTTSNINYGNSKLSFEYDIEEFVDWKREN